MPRPAPPLRMPRRRTRLKVLFSTGLSGPHQGTTLNVSPGGLAIAAPRVPAAGAALQLALVDEQGQVLRARGLVAWVQPGTPSLGLQGTMGVELTSADSGFLELAASAVLGA